MNLNVELIKDQEDLTDYLSRTLDKYIGEMETPELLSRFHKEIYGILEMAYHEGILDKQYKLIEFHPGYWAITDEDEQDTNQPS